MAKDNRVTIRLTDSDREWLDGLSAKSGLTITEGEHPNLEKIKSEKLFAIIYRE